MLRLVHIVERLIVVECSIDTHHSHHVFSRRNCGARRVNIKPGQANSIPTSSNTCSSVGVQRGSIKLKQLRHVSFSECMLSVRYRRCTEAPDVVRAEIGTQGRLGFRNTNTSETYEPVSPLLPSAIGCCKEQYQHHYQELPGELGVKLDDGAL